jgi:flagellar hook assembly protein FlgD
VETAGSGTVPVQFEIGNYPNPFNPQTTIHFSIDRTENVKIMIYDIRGRAIRTLVNKTLNGGIYNTVWDGKNDSGNAAASGIYFAMLRSGEKVKIHKMMLVR